MQPYSYQHNTPYTHYVSQNTIYCTITDHYKILPLINGGVFISRENREYKVYRCHFKRGFHTCIWRGSTALVH